MDIHPDKIIFLDIDHVLTNTDLDDTSFKHFDPSRYRLSKINLHWLDVLLEKSKAKIIIASNWRKFKPPYTQWEYGGKLYNSTLEPFKKLYGKYIVGMLPPERHATKCECLELWFEDNEWFNKSKSKYVILEDDTREGYQSHLTYAKHLVLTDYHFGLTENDVNKALKILGT